MHQAAPSRNQKANISKITIGVFCALLVLPGLSVGRLGHTVDLRFVLGYAFCISLATVLLNRHDKKRAESGGWRTPEAILHWLELLGGWPAAFLTQRALRHKTSKTSYQALFWLIIFIHQIVALDFLRNWEFSKHALFFLS